MFDEGLAQALGAGVRRRILHLLCTKRELAVQDVSEALDISLPLASKHLKLLYNLRLLKRRREAQRKLYSLKFGEIKELDEIYSKVTNRLKWHDMDDSNFHITGKKAIIKIRDSICQTPESLVTSDGFKTIVKRSLSELQQRESIFINIFRKTGENGKETSLSIEDKTHLMVSFLKYLIILPIEQAARLVPGANCFLENKELFFNYIEYLYDYWRSFDRFIISIGTSTHRLDKRPYRTFNATIETLTHLVRQVYRDIQENITQEHPNVYRQIRAGAGFATIAIPVHVPMPLEYAKKIGNVSVIRQVLLNPPIVLDPPVNKRKGAFIKVDRNPIDIMTINSSEWLCYPAKVGSFTLLVYFHEQFYDLGFSLSNLFEIATDEDLSRKPDGIYFFGAGGTEIDTLGKWSTVFYDDEENGMVIAAVPGREEFGYFGYLKKMILTIHNVRMLKEGAFPFHGSLTRIIMDGNIDKSVLIIGDTGAGKSETLEAFRNLGGKQISDIIIIADDMGSLSINDNGDVVGKGTEIGAFLRLDDLSPSSTFGTIDRAIFMSVNKVNSRVVIPVTALHHVLRGTRVDMVLYANNYEEVDEDHPLIEKFETPSEALKVFREGAAMSKGTTASTGLQKTYFVNPFGIPSYKKLHEKLAKKTFEKLFENKSYVAQVRTRLGIKGMEKKGPLEAAQALLSILKQA